MSLISKRQISIIQAARHVVKKLSNGVFADDAYRIALVNTGGVENDGRASTTQLDQAGFESMMALLEDMGFRERDKPENHWRSKFNGLASTRQVYMIKQLAAGARYSIESMCLRHSNHRASIPEKLTPGQAHGLIEAFKDITSREKA